jgi:hypothetical protein
MGIVYRLAIFYLHTIFQKEFEMEYYATTLVVQVEEVVEPIKLQMVLTKKNNSPSKEPSSAKGTENGVYSEGG